MQLLTKSFCPTAIVFAFTGTGFGRFTAVGGAFQSELLCANSGPLIEKTASAITAPEQLTEFRDFLIRTIWRSDFSRFKLDHVDAALLLSLRHSASMLQRPGP